MDEANCKWVSSRGILKSCDRHNRVILSSNRHIDDDIIDNIKDYTSVHVCSWLTITNFIKNFVPKLKNKIIVVSNDSDMDSPIFEKPVGPGDEIAKDKILEFINSDLCVHWFAQNCTLRHPKVSAIPIGMDYHTYTYQEQPVLQEKRLNITKNISKPFHQRKLKCYGNFHFTMSGKYYTDDRISCFTDVPKNLVDYEPQQVPRGITWSRQTEYAFVLSPAGGGMDCHRTWEALLLGCIPIVLRYNTPFEDVYDDLPILVVNKWSDVTEKLLKDTVDTFKNRAFSYDKLTLKYWTDIINSYKVQTS